MECQRCFGELSDDSVIADWRPPDTASWSLRNWITCQQCNRVICFNCCRYPESGYCDQCIARYNLTAELIELGLMTEGV